MKKNKIKNSIIAGFLATSSLAFAQTAQTPPQEPIQQQENKHRHEMMEKWKNMTPQERQAQFLQKTNERVDKDLKAGIINESDAKTLRSANKIIAEKILPQKEKEWQERMTKNQQKRQAPQE